MAGETQGDRISQVRRLLSVILNRDVGQGEMASMIGVSHAYLGHMETNHRGGSKETIAKIVDVAKRYGMDYVTAGWIMFGEGEGPPKLGAAPSQPPPPAAPQERIIPLGRGGIKKPSVKKELAAKSNPRKRKRA